MNPLQLIIPLYQDRETLEILLPDLIKKHWSPEQITVVDASDENPFPIVNSWGVQVLHLPPQLRGRAKQMNYGVEHSQSEALLFLHVDTSLPVEAQSLIQEALSNGKVGGGFSRRFDSPSIFLKFTCILADLRGKWTGWYFGDQAIFCSRAAFKKAGGFPEISPFEDVTFCRKLKKLGLLAHLKPGILTSARRFQTEGPVRKTLKDLLLTLAYFKKNRSRVIGEKESGHDV